MLASLIELLVGSLQLSDEGGVLFQLVHLALEVVYLLINLIYAVLQLH